MAKEKKKQNLRVKILYVLSGSILTEKILQDNIVFILSIAVIIALYITNGYICTNETIEIEKLQIDLKDVKYENQIITTKLVGASRQSKVQEQIKKEGLDLEVSIAPSYLIHDEDD